jgi:antitoxin component of MazEF toxin-antitoxin module
LFYAGSKDWPWIDDAEAISMSVDAENNDERVEAFVIRPAEATVRTGQPKNLDALLEAITPENLHGEWQTGTSVGREDW